MEKITWDDGTKYFGNVTSGLPNGTGVAFYTNGDVYYGGWKMGVPTGQGVLKKNSRFFNGNFESGKYISKS